MSSDLDALVKEGRLERALELYGLSKLDFAKAHLAASAERSGVGRVASFDRALDAVSTIVRVEP